MQRTCNWCAWLCGRRGTQPTCGNYFSEQFTSSVAWGQTCPKWQLEPDVHARANAARRDMGAAVPDLQVIKAAPEPRPPRPPRKPSEPRLKIPGVRQREKGKSKWGFHEMVVGTIRSWSARELGYDQPVKLRNLLACNAIEWKKKHPGMDFKVKQQGDQISIERIA